MSEDETTNNAPFSLDRLCELIELMEKHGLTEVSLQKGDQKWRVRRGAPEASTVGAYAAPIFPVTPAVTALAPTGAAAEAPVESGLLVIKSPTVGTFYSSPSPDDPPFVTVGSRIGPDTIVCIVEAMKVFNQIPAEVSGTIVEILANSGDSVEFGQPLYRVRPG